jgi:hypothetical protein
VVLLSKAWERTRRGERERGGGGGRERGREEGGERGREGGRERDLLGDGVLKKVIDIQLHILLAVVVRDGNVVTPWL